MATHQAILVVGLGFGDEGKGSIVDYLVRETGAHTVVRYNGGAQAAHNVITPDGRHHTFAQFGSGTLVPGTRTHLSRYMMVEPFSLFREAEHLHQTGTLDALDWLSIDRRALITTPYHQAANRLREMSRGKGRHGSCGRGIGETMADYLAFGEQVLLGGDMKDRARMRKKLRFLREEKLASLEPVLHAVEWTDEAERELRVLQDSAYAELCGDVYSALARRVPIVDDEYFRKLMDAGGTVIFEGAQGALLDENFGMHPYTTWSTTTLQNAYQLLNEQDYSGERVRLGVLRAYATRHGAGPFVTEDGELGRLIPDSHNGLNPWQREFRVGHFDFLSARYALDIVGGVDSLAITNLDRLAQIPVWQLCDGYNYGGDEVETIEDYFERDGNGMLIRIKPSPVVDLDYQGRLTNRLIECRPHYRAFQRGTGDASTDIPAYVEMLEGKLGIPVTITSDGPRAGDKQARRGDAFATNSWSIQAATLGHQHKVASYSVANALPF